MEYLIRFMQVHESFRLAEIKSIAVCEGIDLEITSYEPDSPFCVVKLPNEDAAKRLISRSILSKAIYELWGQGTDYLSLHCNIKNSSKHLWPKYQTPKTSFKFLIDSFQNSRSLSTQLTLINTFSYLDFPGPIYLKAPDQTFTVHENWELDLNLTGQLSTPSKITEPKYLYLGRLIATSARDIIHKYDLKKRHYISTTSMDSELALVTANITLAGPGKLCYDPFVGTGSFPIAAAHFGALVFGSDIDGRSIRGKGGRNVRSNFRQYGLLDGFGGCFIADLTNSPVKENGNGWLDLICCDPPYGVREGLKVLGCRDPTKPREPIIKDGVESHLLPDYIPPKKPFSFPLMLTQILSFAATALVPHARLSFWMPTANDENPEKEIAPPTHPHLEIVSVCTQSFNKWSRKLITYRKLDPEEILATGVEGVVIGGEWEGEVDGQGKRLTANELNPFRKVFFQGFRKE